MGRLHPVMQPRDWLLLLVAFRQTRQGLDPIRVQKGMFLLAQEAGLPESETYRFRAYNYGPMSDELYVDLGRLVKAGLCERQTVEGYSWRRYASTPQGAARARRLARQVERRGRGSLAGLHAIERLLARSSFAELIDDVYRRYPEYAARSVFRGR